MWRQGDEAIRRKGDEETRRLASNVIACPQQAGERNEMERGNLILNASLRGKNERSNLNLIPSAKAPACRGQGRQRISDNMMARQHETRNRYLVTIND